LTIKSTSHTRQGYMPLSIRPMAPVYSPDFRPANERYFLWLSLGPVVFPPRYSAAESPTGPI
jgi:hypothetical protein